MTGLRDVENPQTASEDSSLRKESTDQGVPAMEVATCVLACRVRQCVLASNVQQDELAEQQAEHLEQLESDVQDESETRSTWTVELERPKKGVHNLKNICVPSQTARDRGDPRTLKSLEEQFTQFGLDIDMMAVRPIWSRPTCRRSNGTAAPLPYRSSMPLSRAPNPRERALLHGPAIVVVPILFIGTRGDTCRTRVARVFLDTHISMCLLGQETGYRLIPLRQSAASWCKPISAHALNVSAET